MTAEALMAVRLPRVIRTRLGGLEIDELSQLMMSDGRRSLAAEVFPGADDAIYKFPLSRTHDAQRGQGALATGVLKFDSILWQLYFIFLDTTCARA